MTTLTTTFACITSETVPDMKREVQLLTFWMMCAGDTNSLLIEASLGILVQLQLDRGVVVVISSHVPRDIVSQHSDDEALFMP